MTVLIIGLLIWSFVHFLKRLSPSLRQTLDEKMGVGPARGVISVSLLVSVILMIIGYRSAPFDPVYSPIANIGHLNNLLMIIAVMLMGMGSSKGHMRSWFRHPMLMGVIVWGCAHLLVNGDVASLILFGGMIVWALVQIVLINRSAAWVRPEAGPIAGDIKLAIITLIVFTVIAAVHVMLGYNPFLGSYA